MPLFSVDEDVCKGDSICVRTCPAGLLELAPGAKTPTPVHDGEERCLRCGHCVAVCPQGALSHRDVPMAECTPVDPKLSLSPEQAEQFLRSRRSVRAFKDREVSRRELERLLDVTRHSPTGGNSQSLYWHVAMGRSAVRSWAAMVADMLRRQMAADPSMAQRPNLVRFVQQWDEGIDAITRGAPVLLFAAAPKSYALGMVDAAIALSHLELAASAYGLGTCWAGLVMMAANQWPPMQEVMARSLPEGYVVGGAMMIGYPKVKYHRLPARKQLSVAWQP